MVTHQLQVRCRPGKVRRSETDVLPLSYPTNYLIEAAVLSDLFLCVVCELCYLLTAGGYDDVTYWFFNFVAFEISPIFCRLIHISVSCGYIPEYWKKAVITLVAKCHPVMDTSDFRSVFVRYLLCRLVEKLLADIHDITDLRMYCRELCSQTANLLDTCICYIHQYAYKET